MLSPAAEPATAPSERLWGWVLSGIWELTPPPWLAFPATVESGISGLEIVAAAALAGALWAAVLSGIWELILLP